MVPAHPPVARNRPPKSPGVCGRGGRGGRVGSCEQSVNLPMKRRIPGSDRRRSVTEPHDHFWLRDADLRCFLREIWDVFDGAAARVV